VVARRLTGRPTAGIEFSLKMPYNNMNKISYCKTPPYDT